MIHDTLRRYWQEREIANPHLPVADDIATFEAQHEIRMPPVVADYFLIVNGTKEGRSGMDDEDLISFWHLDQVQSLKALGNAEDSTPDAARLFVFADWSIDAHFWAVRLSGDASAAAPVMIVYHEPQQIAASFEEFLDGYLQRKRWALFPEPRRRLFNRILRRLRR